MKFKKGHVKCNIKKKVEERHSKSEPNNSARLMNASDENYGRVNLQRQEYSLFSIVGSYESTNCPSTN